VSRPTRAFQVAAAILIGLSATSVQAEKVVVDVVAEPSSTVSPAADLALAAAVSISYGASEAQSETRTIEVPGRVELDLPAEVLARIDVAAEGWWAGPQVVQIDGPTAVRVALRPTGWIAGRLRVPSEEEMPEEILVEVRPTPATESGEGAREAGSKSPSGRWDCPVAEGAFRCEVPYGRFDLKLRAKGFISHRRWSTEVPAHDVISVGTLELRPGASIIGWVEAPSQDFRFDKVEVRVRPLAAGWAPSALDRQRAGSLLLEAPVNSRGFFEVTSIAPGSYEVVAEHQAFAPARIAPVTVLERAETEIHRVLLEPAVELEVILTPPTDPFRSGWYVELFQQGDVPGHLNTVGEGAGTLEGRWKTGGLAAGDYEIRVSDSRGSRWSTQQLTVGPWSLPVEVELPFERLEGSLKMADEPVAATLFFGGRHGARRIAIRSDDEGKFYVFLPRQEEPWFADVVKPEIGIDVRIAGIEVRKLPGEPWAKTEIDIPDTRIFGTVVDEAGTALGGAVVEVVGPEGEDAATVRSSDETGDFQFVGLESERVRVQARYVHAGRHLSSDGVAVEIGDREDAQPVRLTLFEDLELEGQVLAPHGQGVPGARVMARLHSTQRQLLSVMPSTTTDVEGLFTLRVPQGTERIILSVLAPGFAVRSFPVDDPGSQPLVVELDQTAGTVVVSYSGGDDLKPALRQHRTELFHPHLVAQSGALRQWVELHGTSPDDPEAYVVPMLEPGLYTACYDVGYSILTAGWLPLGGLPDRCASGVLTPHGVLNLTVPVPEPEVDEAAE
jgi:hypothetical protein